MMALPSRIGYGLVLVWFPLLSVAQTAEGDKPAPAATEKPDVIAIAAVDVQWTCQQAENLKFDKPKYLALTSIEQVVLDARWKQCTLDSEQKKQTPEDDRVVVFTNPASMGPNDKVFYGLAKRKDLDNAEKNCAGAGRAAGITLQIVGAVAGPVSAGELGSAMYTYSGVSCEALKDSLAKGNLMTFLGPQKIVGEAIQKKLTHDLLTNVPLISEADKKNIEKIAGKAQRVVNPSVTVKPNEVQIDYGVGKAKIRPPKTSLRKPFG